MITGTILMTHIKVNNITLLRIMEECLNSSSKVGILSVGVGSQAVRGCTFSGDSLCICYVGPNKV